ncbi:MAG: CBS domain-containing protein [Saprospiraceae bacterium]|nr:CBS domain-containing protein [Saprospiraceae bacterium]
MMNEKVETIMIKNLITLGPESTVAHAVEIFKSKRIHHIPVVDEGRLVGLITTHDLWNKFVAPDAFGTTVIKDIMSKKLVKLEPDDKVGTAAELFLDNRFHALPVVKDGMLVGMVTTFDVLRYEFKREYTSEPILFKDVLDKGIDTTT